MLHLLNRAVDLVLDAGIKMLRLLHIQVHAEVLRQFIKFCLTGCSNAAVTYIIFALVMMVNTSLYLLGNLLGYLAGICNAYFWNSRFVFHADSNHHSKRFLRMFCCYFATYIFQVGSLYLLVEYLAVNPFISQIAVILLFIPINFILNKLFVFHPRKI